jgi:acetyltransferase-like isoleucine patch superfamily enzyme
MGERAAIGQFNWISGYKKSAKDPSFYDEPDRRSTLVMENFAVITNRHIIDCTNSVSLGCYSTFAGYNSQIITHGIDVSTSRQRSAPVVIGAYCLVGTRCLLLNGTQLPDYCLLGAGSVLTKAYKETYSLYAGSPAKKIKNLDPECLYFHRKTGFVV